MLPIPCELSELFDRLKVRVRHQWVAEPPHRGEASVLGGRLAASIFSRQESACQRKERQNADAELTAGRDKVLFDFTIQQIVMILRRNIWRPAPHPCDPRGVGRLPSRIVAMPDVAHLPRLHQGIE